MISDKALWLLKRAEFTGKSVYGLMVVLLGLMTIGASGQIMETGIAAKLADTAFGKDINWLILFVAALVVLLSIYLVKALMEMAKDSQKAAVATAAAIQRLCDLVENGKFNETTSDARRKSH